MVSQDGTIGLRSKMQPNGERCLAVGDTAASRFEAGEGWLHACWAAWAARTV